MAEPTGSLLHVLSLLKMPSALARDGVFPDCVKILTQLTGSPTLERVTARRFVLLCRLTGVSWIAWSGKLSTIIIAIVILLDHFMFDVGFSDPKYFGCPSKVILSVTAAMFLVFLGLSRAIWEVAQALAERCLENAIPTFGKPASKPSRAK